MNAGENDVAVIVRLDVRFGNAYGSAVGNFLPGFAGIVNPERDDADCVAMQMDVLGDGIGGA